MIFFVVIIISFGEKLFINFTASSKEYLLSSWVEYTSCTKLLPIDKSITLNPTHKILLLFNCSSSSIYKDNIKLESGLFISSIYVPGEYIPVTFLLGLGGGVTWSILITVKPLSTNIFKNFAVATIGNPNIYGFFLLTSFIFLFFFDTIMFNKSDNLNKSYPSVSVEYASWKLPTCIKTIVLFFPYIFS